jgi:hypothetical protein
MIGGGTPRRHLAPVRERPVRCQSRWPQNRSEEASITADASVGANTNPRSRLLPRAPRRELLSILASAKKTCVRAGMFRLLTDYRVRLCVYNIRLYPTPAKYGRGRRAFVSIEYIRHTNRTVLGRRGRPAAHLHGVAAMGMGGAHWAVLANLLLVRSVCGVARSSLFRLEGQNLFSQDEWSVYMVRFLSSPTCNSSTRIPVEAGTVKASGFSGCPEGGLYFFCTSQAAAKLSQKNGNPMSPVGGPIYPIDRNAWRGTGEATGTPPWIEVSSPKMHVGGRTHPRQTPIQSNLQLFLLL